MCATVTAIGPRRNGTSARSVALDGEDWRDLPSGVIRSIGLSAGDRIDVVDLATAVRDAEPTACRERAVRLIQHRDRSTAEMTRRLQVDGFSDDVIHAVVSRFIEVGLLNDDALCARIVADMLDRRKLGPRRIRMELAKRGFDPDLVASATEALLDHEQQLERAIEAARRLIGSARDVQRLAERLVRLGYDWELARRSACLAWEDVDDGPA